MADPYVRQARGVFSVTIGSTNVSAGDFIYFDGTDWELADATDNTKFAEAMVIVALQSGEVGAACISGIVVDLDAPYTQNDPMYLSATAGEMTATRPTGARNLVQVVGFCLSTSEVRIEVGLVKELSFMAVFNANTDSSIAIASNDHGGPNLIDTSGEAYAAYMCPQNVVGDVIQYMAWICTTALDASDTYTIDTAAGVDDDATTLLAAGIAAAALTCAADDINTVDVSAAFHATAHKPGQWVGVNVAKAAEGTAGDDPGLLGVHVVLLGV